MFAAYAGVKNPIFSVKFILRAYLSAFSCRFLNFFKAIDARIG